MRTRLPITLLALLMLTGVMSTTPAGAAPDPPWQLTMAAVSSTTSAAPIYSTTSAIALNPANFYMALWGAECWRDGAQKTVKNHLGGALYRATINVEWCEAGGKVMSGVKSPCYTAAWYPYYETQKCTTSLGVANQSTQTVYGHWQVGIGVGAFAQKLNVNLKATLTAGPGWYGTWTYQYVGW